MTDMRIAFVQPDQPPRYHHTDVDGDRLLITTADIPGTGPGVYFKTDPNGSSVPVADLPALIGKLTAIEAAARGTEETAPVQARRTLTPGEYNAAWHAVEGAAGEPGADPGTVLHAVLDRLGIQPPPA
ncbi:hypothetical protein [Streptomyces sp. RTd22]|uniref:hypothetical protein n=1 Tax=Streptomyces sp. RTd22 TaxID=1841249 RepID=UPI0007C48275|nr:hypothetical protein [Streptomyces sp. RTd22]